jgi:ribose transport system permease protein
MAEQLQRHRFLFALFLAVLLYVLNVIAQPSFGDSSHWTTELAALAPLVLVAMASTPAIVSGGGGIDISVGPLAVCLNSVLIVWLLPHAGLRSVFVAIPIVLLMGTMVGALNGVLVAVFRYQPVIATLCVFFVLIGLAVKIAPTPQSVTHIVWLEALGGKVGPVPGALLTIGIPSLFWFGLSRTSFHRNLYAVGSNDVTAYSAGVRVGLVRIIAYALGGLLAAVAGIALTALLLSTQATSATSFTLIALAAVALGGTALTGGRGGMLGSVLGALCIYEIQTLLVGVHVANTWNEVAYGVMLIVGVVVGARIQRTRVAV